MHKDIKKIMALALMLLILLGALNMAMAEDAPGQFMVAPGKAETPCTEDATVTIVWEDDDNACATRPEKVTVYMLGSDGSQYSTTAQSPADGGMRWLVTFDGLPRRNREGEINYSVRVKAPRGYLTATRGLEIHLTLAETRATATPAPATRKDQMKAEAPGIVIAAPAVSEKPVKETEAPAIVTAAPVVSGKPAKGNGAHVIVTPAPVVSEEPVTETEAPATETPAPVESEEPAEATEAPAEETKVITYERDENGCLVLDDSGMPVAIVPEGMDIPVAYQRDEAGALVLNENGDPIPTQTVPAGSQKLETLTDLLNPNRRIDVYASWEGDTLYFGDEMTLIAALHGYENAVYTLQWQVSEDAQTWTDIEGATGISTSVLVTEENYLNYWRVQVVITAVDGQ